MMQVATIYSIGKSFPLKAVNKGVRKASDHRQRLKRLSLKGDLKRGISFL